VYKTLSGYLKRRDWSGDEGAGERITVNIILLVGWEDMK
jgi:hypothetical protein